MKKIATWGFTVFSCLLVLAAVGYMAVPANAQVLYGSIIGTITDQSGAVIPGATVKIINVGTQQTREAQTDEGGRYSLINVLPGTYTLSVTAQGFRKATQKNFSVTINKVNRLDLQLEVGAVTESVTVSAVGAELKTDKADVSSQLNTEAVTNLPLSNYRNYQELINLVPGATPARFQNAVVDTPERALSTNINGTNRNSNNTRVDGATSVNIWLPHHTLYVPPVETIQTVNITTASFDAEQGMAGGAAITVATKSGTNSLHGEASWYHDNQHLRARNYFLGTPQKPKSINNIVNGTIAGPMIKDKLFYFFGFERYMQRAGEQGNFSVPTADQRAGNFSAYPDTIYDPLTGNPDGSGRTPFPNNTIPTDRLSPIILNIQKDVPLPNLPGTTSNYAKSGTQAMDRNNWDLKVNYNPLPSHAFFGKWSRMDALVNGINALGNAGGPGLGTLGTGDTTTNLLTFADTWTISPTFLVDVTYGWSRYDQTVFGPFQGTNWGTDKWHIPGSNTPTGPGTDQVLAQCPATACYSGMPAIRTGYTNWGNGSGWMPLFRHSRSYTLTTNVSKIIGAHNLRWGFDMVRFHMDHWQPETSGGPRGQIYFSGNVTATTGYSPGQFNTYADALLGLVNEYSKGLQFKLMTNREWQFGWYFRDRWQATRKLTLDLGVRYEYYPLLTRADRGLERWDPATNIVTMGGIGNIPYSNGMTTSKKLIAPRVGLAYRINEKTVIRSGYGITFDPLPFSRPLRGLYPATIPAVWPSDSYQWVNNITEGIPEIPIPDISTGRIPLPPGVNMAPRSPWAGEIHRGYIQSWNFTIQRELPGNFTTSIAYVGNSTVHQLADIDINSGFPGSGNTGRPLYARLGRKIRTNMWDGYLSSNYHSLQIAINRHFSNGLFLKGAYTYSKALGMTSDDGWTGINRNWAPMRRWNYARQPYDRTQMFVMGFVYELPFGANKPYATAGVVSALLQDWQINGMFSSYTGTPFSIWASGSSLDAPSNSQTADQVKPNVEKLGNIGPGELFFDTSAFKPVTDVRFGNTGKNILTGPGMVNLDFSIFRTFNLTERLKMEFKASAFNISNTAHFNNPNHSVTSSAYGQVRSARDDERQFRFGLRFSF